MKQQKIELIISKSKVIFEAIYNNLSNHEFITTIHIDNDYQKQVLKFAKIDLLIIDDCTFIGNYLNIKNIINLTMYNHTNDDIFFKKPFKLVELLNIIKAIRNKGQIFCCINHELIYDEESCKLYNSTSTIRFTEKENEVFKALLLTDNNRMSKDSLHKYIWQYHAESNSSTIETHMSRLKQKLPQSFMQLKDAFYELMITDII